MTRTTKPPPPDRAHPRMSRRRQSVARLRRKRIVIGLVLVVGVAVLVWAVFLSSLLVVMDVRVRGARRTGRAAVHSKASVAVGKNLLLLSTARVEALVEELPWVGGARVDRKLPGTIRVFVSERRPSLVAALGGEPWLIDSYGHLLLPALGNEQVPVLSGWVEPGLSQGGVLAGGNARDALKVWRSLPEALRGQLVGVFAPSMERITLFLRDDTQVRYGSARNLDDKHKVLRAVLARLRNEGRTVAYIDVRAPSNPAVSEAPVVSPPATVRKDAPRKDR